MRFENQTKTTPTEIAADQDTIRHLPQFFRSTPDYIYRLGGPIYRKILDCAPLEGERRLISIDSRVHMLMPGFLPCIGGWHCDDFHRPTGKQPDLFDLANKPEFQATHHAIILGADVAPTVFADESFHIPDTALQSDSVYRECHREIMRIKPSNFAARPGNFVTFGSLSFHRGSIATGRGWRLFVRITESDHYEPMNEIRTQTQVYLFSEANGW